MADLASAVILIAYNKDALITPNGTIYFSPVSSDSTRAIKDDPIVKAIGGPWVLFLVIIGSLFASFVLLGLEWYKAQKIIKSRGIVTRYLLKTNHNSRYILCIYISGRLFLLHNQIISSLLLLFPNSKQQKTC